MPDRNLVPVESDEMRLKRLLKARLEVEADRDVIDRRIWDLFGEHWSILITDLSGYSRKVEAYGITHFIQSIYESHGLFIPVIDQYDGWLLQDYADNLLVLFRNPEKALSCAIALQHATRAYNSGRDPLDQILVCVGLGKGDVLRVGRYKIFGQEVNAASKLGEDRAKAGDIFMTGAFHDSVSGYPGVRFEPLDDVHQAAGTAFRTIYDA